MSTVDRPGSRRQCAILRTERGVLIAERKGAGKCGRCYAAAENLLPGLAAPTWGKLSSYRFSSVPGF